MYFLCWFSARVVIPPVTVCNFTRETVSARLHIGSIFPTASPHPEMPQSLPNARFHSGSMVVLNSAEDPLVAASDVAP